MTAETAVVLPALALLLAASVWLVGAVGAQLRCVDAARDAARELARGEPRSVALEAVARTAPAGATTAVEARDGLVRVTVTADVRGPGPVLRRLPTVRVQGVAAVAAESDAVVSGGGS